MPTNPTHSTRHDEIMDGNRLIAEFMGFPKVTPLSFWDYNRSLDNASQTRALCVDNINEQGVKFKEEMPFKRYGIEYFDGNVFAPIGYYTETQKNAPFRPYRTSWDWLMPVWIKFRHLKLPNRRMPKHEALKMEINHYISYGQINAAFCGLSDAIKWYNKIPTND